jgi:hypothetical protein
MADNDDVSCCERALQDFHKCTPTFIESVPVKETLKNNTLWQGVVHVFKIRGRPKAEKAYAWTSLVEGSDELQYFTVLHEGRITSPQVAVRAVIWENWGLADAIFPRTNRFRGT